LIEINSTVLKGTFLRRRLKRFKQRRDYLFLNSKEESEREGERGVEEDLNNNDDRNELSDLIKRVEVIKEIKVED
jgi:hypothetical protein